MPALIKVLNHTLQGWGNYRCHVVSSEAFSRVDTYVYKQLWRMLRRRHPEKSKKWLASQYWFGPKGRNSFSVKTKTKQGDRHYSVVRVSSIGIRQQCP